MSMRARHTTIPALLVAMMVLLLAGCGGAGHDDLQQYINEVRASKTSRIEPLPEFVPVENFAYAADALGDPFMSWQAKRALAARASQPDAGDGLRPDTGRPREPLEAYPLDTLRMVGTMQKGGTTSALVQSPDGLVSRVLVGNYLGQNYGRVVSIDQDRMELVEIVPDGLGAWIKRPASLAIVE